MFFLLFSLAVFDDIQRYYKKYDDALFYMRTRGISKEDAKTILTFAFASEAVEKLSIDELSEITTIEIRLFFHLN